MPREPDESETTYFTRRFAEASNEDDLDAIDDELKQEGYDPKKYRPRKSERRKELKKQGASLPARREMLASKALTPEMRDFVESVYVPRPLDGADGFWDGYEVGKKETRQEFFLALLALQHLSGLGIQQAKPLVDMAKELRGDVGQAAQAAAAGVGQALQPQIQELANAMRQGALASAPNPFANVMAQAMQPMIMQAFGGIARALFPGQVPQPGGGQPQGQPPVGFQQSPQPAEPKQPPLHIPPEEADQWTEA